MSLCTRRQAKAVALPGRKAWSRCPHPDQRAPLRKAGRKFNEYKEKYNKELLEKLQNDKPPPHKFKDDLEFTNALKMRTSVIGTMLELMGKDQSSSGYGLSEGDFTMPAEWEQTGRDTFTMKIAKDVTPAKAVKSIFENTKETHLDCLMLMVAAQYKALLDSSANDDEFNAMFPAGKGLVISQAPIAWTGEHHRGPHPFEEKKVVTDAKSELNIVIDPADPTKELLPGDWVYFANIGGSDGLPVSL